jgi:hypothetical protein
MNHAMDIPALERLIDAYCAAWSETDGAVRARLLADVWTEAATYTDPRAQVTGTAELAAHIGRVLASRPGARVIRTSAVDTHHGLARFAWRVVEADGTMLPEGIDFAEVSAEGKLTRIVGFFGPMAPRT